jgi:hypothetical protein
VIARTFGIALLSALGCVAQEQTATLAGTVVDPLGSPIPKAMARLESENTKGLRFSTDTNDSGQFRFADLPAGTYSLVVLGPGFSEWYKAGILMLPGQQTLLPNAVLNVGIRCGDPFIEGVKRLAPGEDSGTLRGSVLDRAGSPIVEANVSLNCGGCATKTNEEGQFIFSHLTPGTYTLTVSMNRFYREFLRDYSVRNNLDWTYAPIHLKRCPFGGCGLRPQRK